jgi:hypothetical protein
LTTSRPKHTVISKRDLNVYLDSLSGEVITYTLSEEELFKYRTLPKSDKMSKPFALSSRNNKHQLAK